MIPITKDDLARWRAEIDLGVEFRDKEFGTYRSARPGQTPQTTLAGLNIDAFEQGARDSDAYPFLNLVFPIVKTIVPTQFFQTPRAVAIPDQRGRPEDADDAFYVSELLNRDIRDVDFRFKATSQQAVWDSFVLGYGVVKIGYATEFGADILPTEKEEKQRFRERIRARVQQAIQELQTLVGLAPKTQEQEVEPQKVQEDSTILSESAYLQWIDPFDFVIDPRARDLADALWVAQRVRKTVASVKRNRNYSKERLSLVGDALNDERIPLTVIEEFQTVDIWEVHYKAEDSPTGIRVLTFAATQESTTPLLHEDNAYDLGGWQYEWLTPNKHGHRLYPISTVSVIQPLLKRMNRAFYMLLEQLDKFIAKVAANERVKPDSKEALKSGVIGALVEVDGREDVRGAVAVVSMDQLNAEMVKFLDYVMDFIILIVGLTRAQLTGLTTAQTATEAQIGQSGQNLRRIDESGLVGEWANRIVAKLWRVKAQFQSFSEIDLPRESVSNPQTGMETVDWYPRIDLEREARLKRNRFRVHIELGSIQKPNLEIVRAQFEQFARTLMEPAVTQGLALEGKRLSANEIIRQWLRFFTEYGMQQLERIIVPVQDETLRQQLLNFGQKPETVNGNGGLSGEVPNRADLISQVAGEKGQGVLVA